MRDTHIVIVDDGGKVICWESVGLEQNRVCREGVMCVLQGTKDKVVRRRSSRWRFILKSKELQFSTTEIAEDIEYERLDVLRTSLLHASYVRPRLLKDVDMSCRTLRSTRVSQVFLSHFRDGQVSRSSDKHDRSVHFVQ